MGRTEAVTDGVTHGANGGSDRASGLFYYYYQHQRWSKTIGDASLLTTIWSTTISKTVGDGALKSVVIAGSIVVKP